MIDIVFGDNACGGLKLAQHFGEGTYHGGAFAVFAVSAEGREPTKEEIEAAQKRAEESMRRKWENAEPMGGNSGDVYGFGLGLDIGDISELTPGQARYETMLLHGTGGISKLPDSAAEKARAAFEDVAVEIKKKLDQANDDIKEVLQRSAAGEPVRAWYSIQPGELCGFCWLMEQLDSLGDSCGPISSVALPRFIQEEDRVISENGWGDVSPGEWHSHLKYEEPVTPILRKSLAHHWSMLREENAPLRAVVNGQLLSVPEDFYDPYIRRELAREPEIFHEAQFIGRFLGRYFLGIGDALIALRVQSMVDSGELAVSTPSEEGIGYRRYLRKVNI